MVPTEELEALVVKWKRMAEIRNKAWEGGERIGLRYCAMTLTELIKQHEPPEEGGEACPLGSLD